MSTFFVSDLHLDPRAPDIARRFLSFLDGPAREARSLYLLGDLFEAWLGDDDPEPAHRAVIDRLASLTRGGLLLQVMQGNRDFLLGERFCSEAGATMLHDPVVLTLAGQRVLVTHGDALCVDDTAYQRLRALVRDPEVRGKLEALPLDRRRMVAQDARSGSREHLAKAGAYITDVNQAAVESVMRKAKVQCLIHGHTHRPGQHQFEVDGRPCTRYVLGDWHGSASYLRWNDSGFALARYPA